MTENPQVFICYGREDETHARRLNQDLKGAGLNTWFDRERLLPGQKWEVEIKKAIGKSRFFIALLSSRSVNRRGFVQKELAQALSVLDEFPESGIFLIPARLDDCSLPTRLQKLQWVDMFPSWSDGLEILKRALNIESPSATIGPSSTRELLMGIIKLGTRAYFREIDEAKSHPDRLRAISELRDAVKSIKSRFKMPEEVYELYLQECIKQHELMDWDEWLVERMRDMSDLPNELQQSLFNYAITRLISVSQEQER